MHDPHDAARTEALSTLAAAVAAAEQRAGAPRASREDLLDARRRLDVLRRQQQALLARADRRVTGSTAVVGHRQAWAATRLSSALAGHGIEVVDALDNAADVVGATGALQPGLLVVEDRLPMMRLEDLLAEARALAPDLRVVVQVDDDVDPAAVRAAGADAVVGRRAPIDDLVAAAARLLSRPDEPAQSVD